MLLAPILAFASQEAMAEIEAASKGSKPNRVELLALIPTSVLSLYDYWRARRKPTATGLTLEKTSFRTKRRVSRNEPCPCGSGKKFKKCCGVRVE